jgi:hypothetical protein
VLGLTILKLCKKGRFLGKLKLQFLLAAEDSYWVLVQGEGDGRLLGDSVSEVSWRKNEKDWV